MSTIRVNWPWTSPQLSTTQDLQIKSKTNWAKLITCKSPPKMMVRSSITCLGGSQRNEICQNMSEWEIFPSGKGEISEHTREITWKLFRDGSIKLSVWLVQWFRSPTVSMVGFLAPLENQEAILDSLRRSPEQRRKGEPKWLWLRSGAVTGSASYESARNCYELFVTKSSWILGIQVIPQSRPCIAMIISFCCF